jgi:hypothetical protein
MRLQTHQNGGTILTGDSAGGTPMDAVETTVLPKKSRMIRAFCALRNFCTTCGIAV